MPWYTYRCPDHGDFEVEVPMSETTPTWPCPEITTGEHLMRECPKVLNANIDKNSLRQNPKKTK